MLNTISREVDYITESAELLRHLGTGETYAGLRESLSRKYAVSFREGLQKFKLLEQIEHSAEKVFATDMEEIRYYFSKHSDGEISCAGKVALLWEESAHIDFKELNEFSRYLDGLSENEYCKKFGKCLQGFTSLVQDEHKMIKTKEPFSVISRLMEMDIRDEEKWKLQKIFFDRKEHQERVFALLEKASALLKDYQKELAELAEAFYGYWTDRLAGRSPAAYIHEMTEIDLGESPSGFQLYPSMINLNAISIYSEAEEDGSCKQPDIFKIGILFDEDFDLRTNRTHTEGAYENYVTQVLKLLGDRSKFEILSYIRDREAYGSELAKRLNLTTATVSHHMNALLAAGLVEIRRVDNRIYYLTNKKALREVLDYGGKILTGES